MEDIKLKFVVAPTDSSIPLGIRVCLDGSVIYENAQLADKQEVQHQMSDADGEHELTFELFGKLPGHTKINEAGEIVSDAMISVSSIEIDEINIDQIVQKIAVYYHDFNGTQAPVEAKFYDNLGCNGTVKLKFNTPLYLWLLENL